MAKVLQSGLAERFNETRIFLALELYIICPKQNRNFFLQPS
jgi:hypothetical protein